MATALSDFSLSELQSLFTQWGHRPAHARTLLKAFFDQNGDIDFSSVNIGTQLIHRLNEQIPARQSTIAHRRQSADGTVKLLLTLTRGGSVETVLMPDYRPDRAAGCLSSQIGCAVGCAFCASTANGLERNLHAGEIIEQFLHLRREAHAASRRLSTIVFMGMGEPLFNLDNVLAAIRIITTPDFGLLGARQITISTVGIPPTIDRLADADPKVALAISLHAPDDATRNRLVPMNKRHGIHDVLAAARRFQQRTGRPVTISYCLLDGINDSDEHARMLAELLGNFRVHVNLIPHNPIGPGCDGIVYRPSPQPRLDRFHTLLREAGIAVHSRRARGEDIDAACGQLRRTTLLLKEKA